MNLLVARSVVVNLGGRRVLDVVDCSVRAGEVLGFLGPNGAGKTTLLRALAGLQVLQSGGIRLLDQDLDRYSPSDRARRLAYMPQGGQCHWPMTVAQVVALGRLPYRAPWGRVPVADGEAVQRAMHATDIEYLAHRPTTELSGGERTRVLLARALAVESQLLLVDEPIAGLDPAHQLGVMEILRTRAQSGAGVVVVLHDLTLAARFCDRVLLLDKGRALAEDVPRQVLTPGHLQEVYGIKARYEQTNEGMLIVPVQRT